jgi:hypothetical protein
VQISRIRRVKSRVAGPHSERLPVRVRVANPEEQLRCNLTVKVQFSLGE